jgi:dihydroorotate dehydrogenase
MDRSYAWNYAHAPSLPRVRRFPPGPGGRLFDYPLHSLLGVAAGPLLNSRWVEGYARVGFDILTYATVTSRPRPAFSLPNIQPVLAVDAHDEVALAGRRPAPQGGSTIAVSLGLPSMEPGVWRKDVRRAKDRIQEGQILIVSVMGSVGPEEGREAFIADYARCAAWAVEAGADVVEAHLAVPDPFGQPGQMVYEHLTLAAQILHRMRATVSVPLVARLGPFRSPRALHDTASRLSPWAHGFVLVHGIPRRIVDAEGRAAFDGAGREWADVVGAGTWRLCSRQVEEMLAWRRAGEWPNAVLAVGGISSVERARYLLREGANAVLVATAALEDPLFALRFRQAASTAAA